ncbi:MAG: serine/threonine-protein kinase [Myxococcota bacterium]
MMPTACLDEVRIVGLIEGRLTSEELAAAEAHIDSCAVCHGLLAELARGEESRSGTATPSAGEVIGRYVMLTQVGAGGMGMVFAAWDPELDRKIALKLVTESAASDEKAQDRLVDEAKALASIRHPNVISIYDVGRVGGRVFIAMEYMEAGTLRTWLSSAKRSWRVVLSKFIAAGRGLAAAHDGGLVHRDFKPDNVLFSAKGRCVVTDFGLALAPPEGFETSPDALPSTTAWGTPGYMAPEALRHVAVTPRADQFSFCVALWEALHGAPPFGGKTIEERLAAVRDGVRREPPPSDAPAAVRRVVNRGLSLDPSARYETMDALLKALEGAASPSRRAGWLVAGAGLAGVGALSIARGDPECDGARSEWRPMWSDDARDELASAFAATTAAGASETFRRFAGGVDEYVERWASAHRSACQLASGSAAERRTAVHAMQCLSGQRVQAFALLEALSRPTEESLEHSLTAVASLPPPTRCSQAAAVAEVGRESNEELERELASIDTIWRLSQPEIVRPRLEALEKRAEEAGARAILAGVRVNQGKIFTEAADHEAAHASLVEGGMLALASGAPEIAMEAWVSLMALDGAERQRFDWAAHWEQLATAMLAQLGEETRWHAMLAAHQGLVRANNGNWSEARAAWERAVEIGSATLGEAHPDVISFRVRLGEASALLGDFEAAREQQDRALEQNLALYGEVHRETARTLRAIGVTLVQQGKLAEALEFQQRGLEIQRAVLPEGHREIGYTLGNLGITMAKADPDNVGDARAKMEEGLAIIGESQEQDHTRVLILRHQIARALMGEGKLQEARDRWREILEEVDLAEANPAVIARVHLRLGIVLRELEDWVGSAEQLRRAVTLFEQVHGEANGVVLLALVELGDTLVQANATDLAPLHRALAHPAAADAPEYIERARELLAAGDTP